MDPDNHPDDEANWDDEDDGPDEWDPAADGAPDCDLCFGAGGWGDQDTGWTDCPDCFADWLAAQETSR
jgi:hypothetical protein